MKKLLSLILTLTMLSSLTFAAAENTGSALDAFYALTGKTQTPAEEKTPDQILDDVMKGAFAALPADEAAMTAMAAELDRLTRVDSRSIAAYASANKLSVQQVRNAYYKALATVLRAEITVHPASEEKYRNLQTILALFLVQDEESHNAAREEIRRNMTPDAAQALAEDYRLPPAFVSFLIMDDNWDDDRWDNDDDWRDDLDWDDDADEDGLTLGSRDTRESTRVADLQERLIALGYLNGKADGIFGERTLRALVQYQRANGLKADGVFGEDDLITMLSADVVARWDYTDSFDDSPDDSFDDSFDNSLDDSFDDSYDVSYDDTADDSYDVSYDDTADDSYDVSYDDTADDSYDVSYDDSDD